MAEYDDDEFGYGHDGPSDEEIKALEAERTMWDESEVQFASRMFKEALVSATKSIIKIATTDPNSRVRMAAATYVIERSMGRIQDNAPAPADDPIADLLGEVVSEVETLKAGIDGGSNG